MSYRTSRAFQRGAATETEFLIWASNLAAGVQLARTTHEHPEVYALGWRRGVEAVARAFRSLARD